MWYRKADAEEAWAPVPLGHKSMLGLSAIMEGVLRGELELLYSDEEAFARDCFAERLKDFIKTNNATPTPIPPLAFSIPRSEVHPAAQTIVLDSYAGIEDRDSGRSLLPDAAVGQPARRPGARRRGPKRDRGR